MLGIIIYVSRDFGLLPYNNITAYALVIGSAAEITLLSFALADKINIYKLEKDKAKEKELFALLENERMVREQNLMLEKKVEERTHELHMANEDLNVVLQDLKDKESQLVESEKMAVLGQLTAGIAHEINNPINFVTSNVGPLKRDIEIMAEMLINIEEIGLSDSSVDVKQMQINKYKEDIEYDYLQTEIGHLIKGISEGANRTAEIVKGLRMSSRLDESDLRKADINDGLDTTMVLVNNLLGDKIRCVKDFGDLPLVECYPGKMNQVFLNIISNAIHAIAKKHQNDSTGVLNINTSLNEKSISIRIRDNGTGMDENTKKKIFEPFFTTKAVGEGTGLGMSIAYNIIKKHNGHILINSTVGQGTEFVIDIPIIHDIISN
jgi:signal transduction histidine kinase